MSGAVGCVRGMARAIRAAIASTGSRLWPSTVSSRPPAPTMCWRSSASSPPTSPASRSTWRAPAPQRPRPPRQLLSLPRCIPAPPRLPWQQSEWRRSPRQAMQAIDETGQGAPVRTRTTPAGRAYLQPHGSCHRWTCGLCLAAQSGRGLDRAAEQRDVDWLKLFTSRKKFESKRKLLPNVLILFSLRDNIL